MDPFDRAVEGFEERQKRRRWVVGGWEYSYGRVHYFEEEFADPEEARAECEIMNAMIGIFEDVTVYPKYD